MHHAHMSISVDIAHHTSLLGVGLKKWRSLSDRHVELV